MSVRPADSPAARASPSRCSPPGRHRPQPRPLLFPECISPDIPVCPTGLTQSLGHVCTRSSLPHGKDEIGGAVTRPHRSFDGCRQPRISPVAGEKQIFEGRRRRPAAGHFAPASPQMWHGARARSARAAVRPERPRPCRYPARSPARAPRAAYPPAGRALLTVTDRRCGNANSHSTSPPTTPRIGGMSLGGSKRKWAFTIARNLDRRFQARQQRGRRARRDRHHHGIARTERNGLARRTSIRATLPAASAKLAQFMPELDVWRPCPATA